MKKSVILIFIIFLSCFLVHSICSRNSIQNSDTQILDMYSVSEFASKQERMQTGLSSAL